MVQGGAPVGRGVGLVRNTQKLTTQNTLYVHSVLKRRDKEYRIASISTQLPLPNKPNPVDNRLI